MKCDTCYTDVPELWLFAHREFSIVIKVGTLPAQLQIIEAGDWGACDDCAAAILRKDLVRLGELGMKSASKDSPVYRRRLHAYVVQLHSNLLKSRTAASPRRSTPEDARRAEEELERLQAERAAQAT